MQVGRGQVAGGGKTAVAEDKFAAGLKTLSRKVTGGELLLAAVGGQVREPASHSLVFSGG